VIGTDRWRSEPPCVSKGVPHGQTESGGIVLPLYSPSYAGPVRPEAALPDRMLCLSTFSHFLIVNRTSLSVASSSSSSSSSSRQRQSPEAHVRAIIGAVLFDALIHSHLFAFNSPHVAVVTVRFVLVFASTDSSPLPPLPLPPLPLPPLPLCSCSTITEACKKVDKVIVISGCSSALRQSKVVALIYCYENLALRGTGLGKYKAFCLRDEGLCDLVAVNDISSEEVRTSANIREVRAPPAKLVAFVAGSKVI
jgi:hypothetical protein